MDMPGVGRSVSREADGSREWGWYVWRAQAVYYLVTGIWPFVSPRTFQMFTGPKADFWLVRTVGVLVAAIGLGLGLAGVRRRRAPEMEVVALGSAAGLAAIDVVYVARGRISPVYLLDALVEAVAIAAWLLLRVPDRQPGERHGAEGIQ